MTTEMKASSHADPTSTKMAKSFVPRNRSLSTFNPWQAKQIEAS
ncbi:unnamed protein product [Ectocarpus fasciculatus]